MDPWNNSEECKSDSQCNQFEDNFVPEISKLPDSEKYLAVLEEKLHKIKNDPNVMRQLAQKKEDCFKQLLSTSEHVSTNDLSLDEPIENPVLLRTILPQKQALTQGEVVELLRHDQLVRSDTTDSSQEKKDNT